jgi:hypothetical protein
MYPADDPMAIELPAWPIAPARGPIATEPATEAPDPVPMDIGSVYTAPVATIVQFANVPVPPIVVTLTTSDVPEKDVILPDMNLVVSVATNALMVCPTAKAVLEALKLTVKVFDPVPIASEVVLVSGP